MLTLEVVGWLAYASAFAAFLGMVFIGIFMKAGEPFGSLNDICIAAQVLLIIPVAFYIHNTLLGTSFVTMSKIGLGILLLGAIPLAIGSALLVTKRITLEQSFRPPFNGYWLIGIWMILASLPAVNALILSTGIGWLGIFIGVAWVTLGFTMWFGGTQAQQSMPMVVGGSRGMLEFIVWAIWLGRSILSSP